jgi:hypothetical protein
MTQQTHIPDQIDAPSAASMLDINEQDLMFNAYYEGDMTQDEREDFEGRLERDDMFRKDYEDFLSVVGGLRSLPFEFAPDNFVEKVQSRIRTRSAGRFFAENYLTSTHVPYEVIALVMIIVMTSAYMMMEAPRDKALTNADVTIDSPRQLENSRESGRSKAPSTAQE